MVSMAVAKIAVLLAATVLVAAAGGVDPQPPQPGNGKETQCWQCYSSCMLKCDNSSSGDVQKYFQCKKSCILDCYKDLPPVCFKMCINETCLTLPADKRVDCYKACGMKCFHYPGPNPGPKPMPPTPTPPKPMPSPPKPAPPKPIPPKPTPPKAT